MSWMKTSKIGSPTRRELVPLKWGLIPSWAKDAKIGTQCLNARAETVAEKPAFRSAFKKRRCLILADGYYEWQKPEDPKQPRRPVHFSLESGEPFFFAALWTRWVAPDGAIVPSCTIVTCEANQLARPIHDRMPRESGASRAARGRGRRAARRVSRRAR